MLEPFTACGEENRIGHVHTTLDLGHILLLERRVDVAESNLDARQSAANLGDCRVIDDIGVPQHQEVRAKIFAGFNEALVGTSDAQDMSVEQRLELRAVAITELLNLMVVADKTVEHLAPGAHLGAPVPSDLKIIDLDYSHALDIHWYVVPTSERCKAIT